jgi:hypothetical protein
MSKKHFLTSLCSLAASGVIHADITDSDLYLFLGGTSSVTSISTSMHDAGSAAANYTLGNSNVQNTSGANSSAYAKNDSSSSAGSTTSSGYSSSDSAIGGLGAKGVISTKADDPSTLIIAVEGGYQSQYVYNGVNRIRLGTATNAGWTASDEDFDMYYLGVSAKWKGLSFGLKFINSLDSDLKPTFDPTNSANNEYSEYVVDLNYTLGLIAGPQDAGNWLDATVGYEFIYYPEDTFWNTDTQGKFYAMLKTNRYKWVRPSVTFQSIESGSRLTSGTKRPGFDLLSGEQVIFQVDGGDVVYSTSVVEIGVGYYVKSGLASGYDKGFSSLVNEDWYQAGLNIPVFFGDFTVTPSVHYTENDAKFLDEPRLWWGINAQYAF